MGYKAIHIDLLYVYPKSMGKKSVFFIAKYPRTLNLNRTLQAWGKEVIQVRHREREREEEEEREKHDIKWLELSFVDDM